MSNKLIDLNALSEYKDYSDAKYQDKLTAGDSISLNSNVISFAPNFGSLVMENMSVSSGTITKVGEITLAPGNYVLGYTCLFSANSTGYRQCGFSTNTTDITGFGRAWGDTRRAVESYQSQTRVDGVFTVSASTHPNGQTFYFLANQNSGSSLTVTPRCYYFKF